MERFQEFYLTFKEKTFLGKPLIEELVISITPNTRDFKKQKLQCIWLSAKTYKCCMHDISQFLYIMTI